MIKAKNINSPAFLSGGGEMGERIRNFDWNNTSLGGPESWSPALQNLLSLMLANRFPMILWWGNDYIQFYNDAYIPIPGLKHPDLLGKPAKECWPEIWHVIGPLIDTPYNGGEPTWMDNIGLQLHRKNFTEETYFTAAYSPVPDSTAPNGIGGVLANVHEITNQIINQRALETLQKISSDSSASNSVNTVYENALLALSENKKDFPFAIIYKIDEAGNTAQLCATTGVEKTHPEIEPVNYLDLRSNTDNIKNIARAVAENIIVHVVNDGSWKDLPKGDWDIMSNEFVHVPVKNLNKKYPHAILTIGLNPYRKFDDNYRNFVKLVSEQIAQGVNNALAYETERKRAEEMEALDKAKTVFFSNISHEFRTPLTLILGPLEELLAKANGNFKEEDKQHLETTHRNAMRLLRLVNSLLDFSRIESGRQEGAFVLTNISEYTIKLSSNFRSLIEKAGLKFTVKADEIIQPVYVDRQMWEKIIFNLLSNAFKYTLKGHIRVTLSAQNNFAVLKIKDTGVGIPPNELPKMFDRFHRVENTAGRTYEGTGIGLSLVKELVNLHGGSINVESSHGQGSTFTVNIPFGKAHLPETKVKESEDVYTDSIAETYSAEFATLLDTNAAPQKINGEQVHLSNELVLIVDDNADMRQHLQSLIGTNYKTMLAVNGMNALDKIKEHQPSLVISDIMMPGMNGIELLKEIKQNPQTQNVPVILLTARAGEESKVQGYETGADDYLTKPFSSKELIARIDSQIKTKKHREDARKKSEQSDASIRNFVNHAPVAICVLRGSDYIVEVANEKMLEIWGRPAQQMLNKPVFEAMPDAADQGLEELLNEVYTTGKPFSANELPVNLIRNGVPELVCLNFVYEPLYGDDKSITSIVAVATEVTEQVKARKKIEESENKFRSVIFNTPAATCLFVGRDLVIESPNKAFIEIGGKGWDIEGKKLQDAYPELLSEKQPILQIIKDVFTSGKEFRSPGTLIKILQNGVLTERYYNVSYKPLFNIDGKAWAILNTAIDVTEQIEVQQKIAESEKRFSNILTQSLLAIAIFKGPEMVIEFINQPMINVLGKGNAVLDRPLLEVIPEMKDQAFPKMLADVYNTGVAIEGFETKAVIVRNGIPVDAYFNFVYQPFRDIDNTITGVTALAADVTEQVLAKKQNEESKNRFRHVLEQAPDPILVLKGENMVLDLANDPLFKVWGVDKSAIGKPFLEILPEMKNQGFVELLQDVYFNDKIIKGIEAPASFNRPDGSKETVYFNYTYQPYREADGKISGVIIIASNVTQQVQAKIQIEESEQQILMLNQELKTKLTAVTLLQEFSTQSIGQSISLVYDALLETAMVLMQSDFASIQLYHPESETLTLLASKNFHPDSVAFWNTAIVPLDSPKIEALTNKQRVIVPDVEESPGIMGTKNLDYYRLSSIRAVQSTPLISRSGRLIGMICTQWKEVKQLTENDFQFFDVLARQASDIFEQNSREAELEEKVKSRTLELKQTEIFLQSIIDSSPAVLFNFETVRNSEGEIIDFRLSFVNSQIEKETGQAASSIIGKTCKEIFPHMFENGEFKRFVNCVQSGEKVHYEGYYLFNGVPSYYHVLAAKFNDGISCTSINITREKNTALQLEILNKELKERNIFVETILDSCQEYIFVYAKDTTLLSINKAAENRAGLKSEDIIGKKMLEIFPKAYNTKGESDLESALQGKAIYNEAYLSPVSGRYVENYFTPLKDADGKVYATVIVEHDVTEIILKQQEITLAHEDITEQIEANKKIEESELQVRKELADTHELQKLSTLLFVNDNQDEIYQKILEVATKLMGSDCASIQVYDPINEQLLLLGSKNFHPRSEKFWQTVNVSSGTPCGEALKTRQRIIITDIETNTITNSNAQELKSYRASGIRSVQSTPLLSREGNLIGMISTHCKTVHEPSQRDLNLMDVLARQAADIIIQRNVAAKLKQSEEQFRVMANSIPQLAWMTDEEGSVQWYNQRWYDYTGTTFQEMQGSGWQKVHHPDTVDSMVSKLKKAFDNHSFWEDEFPLKSKSGEYRWFLSRAYPIKNKDGALRGWFGTNTDVTEQRETTKKIKESEERFHSLIQTLPQLIWVTDVQGNTEFASYKWKEYSGIEPGGEKDWMAILHPDDYTGIKAAWGKSLSKGDIYKFDVRLKSKEGEYRWHTVKRVPVIDKKNKIVKWVGAFTDIHEQKITEEKKDEFISIASHEMKTPLTTAKAYLQMLELTLDDQNEDANLYAKKASQSVERLNELVGELLDVSKLRLGKLNYNITIFNFNEMVTTTVENIQLTSPTHVVIKNGKVHSEIRGDKERLQQVIINLLTNAIKYSPNGNKVFITMEQQADCIKVSVKDTGIGIAQHSLSKIFDKYHRIEEHAVHFQGLGIGLFISYEIIERHHGKLWAESEAGVGSTFYFTIPLNFTVAE